MINTKDDTNINKEYKLPCRKCDGKTFHKVLHSIHTDEVTDYDIFIWQDFEIVRCQGCGEISFRSNSICSEDIHYDLVTGEEKLDENVEIYPNRIAGRKQVKDMYLLPKIVLKIYKETHAALCGKLNILAGIGVRALTESICKEKGANGRSLKQKIDDLAKNGILTKDNAETLHRTRLLGNKAAHGISPSTEEELDIAMDIVENLLKTVYIIPEKALKLPERK